MLTWAVFKEQVRRTILKDSVPDEETNDYRWSDAEIQDCTWWALDQFAAHTAQATSVEFPATGVQFQMPDNYLDTDDLDYTALVSVTDAKGNLSYLEPIKYSGAFKESFNVKSIEGFYEWPKGYINLTYTPPTGSTLRVDYFAYYNHPYADNDTIDVPRWGRVALVYLVSAHTLSGASLKTSIIRQWGAKPDTGTPEHNPIRSQQKWFLDLYEAEMLKHSPQNRTQHYREFE